MPTIVLPATILLLRVLIESKLFGVVKVEQSVLNQTQSKEALLYLSSVGKTCHLSNCLSS